MQKKFIFFDIDGTLAVGTPGNQYIPDSAKEAIRLLRENGHFLSIATGRSYAMAVDTMHQLGFSNMVSDGGNGITIDDKLIDIQPLDYQKCVALIRECEEKNFPWAFSPDNSKRRLTPDKRFLEFTRDIYMETVVELGLDPLCYDKIFKIYIACFEGEEQQLELLQQLPWCRFHKEYFFVEPADKSVGIKRMVDHLGGKYQDVIVFGDEKNDLSMFCSEWTSVAMGNAIDELKARATFVTENADRDGIFLACKKLGLF